MVQDSECFCYTKLQHGPSSFCFLRLKDLYWGPYQQLKFCAWYTTTRKPECNTAWMNHYGNKRHYRWQPNEMPPWIQSFLLVFSFPGVASVPTLLFSLPIMVFIKITAFSLPPPRSQNRFSATTTTSWLMNDRKWLSQHCWWFVPIKKCLCTTMTSTTTTSWCITGSGYCSIAGSSSQ